MDGNRLIFRVEGMDCASCVAKVTTALERVPGLADVEVNLMAERLSLTAATPEAAAQAQGPMGWNDPFSLFGFGRADRSGVEAPAQRADGRVLGKLERGALADLDLTDIADKAQIRVRYTELVKKCHPDSNGGDRSAEHKLQRVLKAWKTLKKAGLA